MIWLFTFEQMVYVDIFIANVRKIYTFYNKLCSIFESVGIHAALAVGRKNTRNIETQRRSCRRRLRAPPPLYSAISPLVPTHVCSDVLCNRSIRFGSPQWARTKLARRNCSHFSERPHSAAWHTHTCIHSLTHFGSKRANSECAQTDFQKTGFNWLLPLRFGFRFSFARLSSTLGHPRATSHDCPLRWSASDD